MIDRDILRMKLKERIIFVLILSVCCLLIVKYKLAKNQMTSSEYGELDYDQINFGLDGDHSHRRRETGLNEVKNEQLRNSEISSDANVNKLGTNDNKLLEPHKSSMKGKKDNKNNNNNENKGDDEMEQMEPWDMWWTMVTERHVTTPNGDNKISRILHALATRKILAAKAFSKGTQLKVSLQLDGSSEQKVVFKPMRYPRDHIIEGKIYDGFDRHNAEIAAFHLDRILGFYRAPPVVGRRVDLMTEIKPFAERRLLKTFFKDEVGDECFYGVCYYCKKAEAACANGKIMEGSVTIWLPPDWTLGKMRHPWQRTYNKRKARWELDKNYCHDVMSVAPYNSGPRLLDIMDTCIFDFLIGNGDRHHYETFKKGGNDGMLLHLDNAKSFGNPNEDELTILAPLMQCCRIRKSTHERLAKISSNDSTQETLSARLRKSLLSDPTSPVLTEPHLQAVDRRLRTAMNIIKNCININGFDNVVKDDHL